MTQLNSYTYIHTGSVAGVTTQVVSGPVTLEAIVINITTAVSVGIFDSTTTGVKTVGIVGLGVASPAVAGSYRYGRDGVRLGTGLQIVTKSAATVKPDITIVWHQG